MVKFKNDYLNYGSRNVLHTSVREDILQDFQLLCYMNNKQPNSKALDVLINMILKDENLKREFLNQLKLY